MKTSNKWNTYIKKNNSFSINNSSFFQFLRPETLTFGKSAKFCKKFFQRDLCTMESDLFYVGLKVPKSSQSHPLGPLGIPWADLQTDCGLIWAFLGFSADFPYCRRCVLASTEREPSKQSLWEKMRRFETQIVEAPRGPKGPKLSLIFYLSRNYNVFSTVSTCFHNTPAIFLEVATS